MNRFIALSALAALAAASQAITIVEWNFNSNPADASTSTGTTAASTDLVVGTPVIGLVGGATATFAGGHSSDPAATDNSGYNTTTYSAQGAGDKSRGIESAVDLTGYKDVVIKYAHRHSNTSSRWNVFQYTTDGGSTWIDKDVFEGTAGDTWFVRTVDLSAITAVNNNANFKFRVVATFKPSTSTYFGTSANTAAAYATSGTYRFDMVNVAAQAVPEPASLLAIGLGATALVARRRRTK